MPKRIEVKAGDTYNLLTVIEEVESVFYSRMRSRRVLCRCECGKETVVRLSRIRSGETKACGCLQGLSSIRHGHAIRGTRSITYATWKSMRQRCLDPNASNYHLYGGRNIHICQQWEDFTAFLEDMGDRPSPNHTIDRINPDGDYAPGNCRWATAKEQGRNRRTNRMLTYKGETFCLVEWAERIGMNLDTLTDRLRKGGYTVEEALTLPVGSKRKLEPCS